MKILNRPMFRYGGPIKEGIMDGIREPRQGYKVPGMVFPGDADRMLPNASKVFANVEKTIMPSTSIDQGSMVPNSTFLKPRFNEGMNTKEIINNFSGSISQVPKPAYTQEDWRFKKESDRVEADQRKRDYMENMNVDDKYVDGYNEQTGQKEKVLNVNYGKDKYMESPTVNIKSGDNPFNYKDNADPNAITDGKKLPEIKTIDTEGNRKKSINNILEKLGYARSQKNALYDALIAGGQRISREGLGKTNLVNDLIADTSTAYDKPEKIREAAELMQVQQDLKLEGIRESKTGGARQQDYDYYINQGDSPALAKQKADGVATTIVAMKERAKKMGDGQGDAQVESVAQQMVDGNWFPDKDYKGTISGKKYDNITEFVESAEFKSEGKGAGIYVVKGKVIELDENGKMIFDKVVTSSTSNSKWWNPLD